MHNSPTLATALIQTNPVYISPSSYFTMHFNIILPYATMHFSGVSCSFLHQSCTYVYLLPSIRATCPAVSNPWFSHTNIIWRRVPIMKLINMQFAPVFYVTLTVHPCIISQINSTSLHNAVQYIYLFLFSTFFWRLCVHHQEIYAKLVFVTWISIQPADQTPPIQSDKYQCRIDTAIFSWRWAHGLPKHVEKRK